jgi:hypothetical protein
MESFLFFFNFAVKLFDMVSSDNTNVPAVMGGVLVMKYGLFGRVCSSGFDDKDAQVVCRQLKYTNGKSMGPGVFGSSLSRAWMADPKCQGNEENIIKNCTYNATIPYSCKYNSSDYASVLCYNGTSQPSKWLKQLSVTQTLGRNSNAMDLIYSNKHRLTKVLDK